MPSVQYYNRTGPFWDFVANLEEQGASHPFFNNNNINTNHGDASDPADTDNERSNPWMGAWAGMPWGPFAYRGPRPSATPGAVPAEGDNKDAGPSGATEPQHPFSDPEEGPHVPRPGRRDHHHHHHHGRHGLGGRGGACGRGRSRAWGRGRGQDFPDAARFLGAFGPLADMFQNQLFGDGNKEHGEDFKPEADVFDAAEAFIVHVSLPGAKKEDVGVNWDAEKSELSIAGVIYRPGDEDLLKTLALSERKVGAFEKKVRLGSRANPAQVDVDGITAKMEDGILRIEVPKLDSGYVEVKRVEIE